MIWSPRVPVFRDDVSLALVEEVIPTNQPNLFDQVALVNMVTSCAVNLGHYKRQGGAVSTAEAEMRRRIELVVRLAASQGSQVHWSSPRNILAKVFPGARAGCLGLWGFPVASRHCRQVSPVQTSQVPRPTWEVTFMSVGEPDKVQANLDMQSCNNFGPRITPFPHWSDLDKQLTITG